MGEKVTEIVITYKTLAHNIFASHENSPNRLGSGCTKRRHRDANVVQAARYRRRHGADSPELRPELSAASGIERIPDAYERLFLDVIRGDQSLFVGREEVEQSGYGAISSSALGKAVA